MVMREIFNKGIFGGNSDENSILMSTGVNTLLKILLPIYLNLILHRISVATSNF